MENNTMWVSKYISILLYKKLKCQQNSIFFSCLLFFTNIYIYTHTHKIDNSSICLYKNNVIMYQNILVLPGQPFNLC